MGDFKVHHIRFFEYEPNAVHCLAYDEDQRKLALSRSDGSIEIWSIGDTWYQEKILPGTDDRSVEALVWCNKRLLSTGLHGYVHEHDLITFDIQNTVSADSGPVWCMALNESKTTVAAGTEEGCVVLFDVSDGALEFKRTLDRQEGRILSLAWYEPAQVIVTGGIDNLRIWSLKSGHAIQRLSPGRIEVNKETVVWAVAITQDFTIVSGDSRGKVCFWNGSQGTQIKSFNVSAADVLCLCLSPDGGSVWASGVQPVVTQFEFIAVQANSDWRRWVKTNVQIKHTHDVRAMVWANDAIISAGVDTRIIVTSLHHNQNERAQHSKKIQAFPHSSIVSVAAGKRLVMLQYSDHLDVWRLGHTNCSSEADGEMLSLKENCMKLLELKSRGDESIVCSALSPCGRWIAYSDIEQVRLFRLNVDVDKGKVPSVSLNKVSDLPATVAPAHKLCFTHDGKHLLIATCLPNLQIVHLHEDMPRLLKTLAISTRESVHLMATSSDNKYFAVGNHASEISIFSLKTHKCVCSLPTYPHQPTAIAFHPTSPILAVLYTDHMIIEFDINSKEYTDWSRELKHSLSENIQWKKRLSPKLLQIFYNPTKPHQIYLRNDSLLVIIDKKERLPLREETCIPRPGKKRPDHCIHSSSKYQFLVHADVLENGDLVVVERTPSALQDSLPMSIKTKKFGT